MFYSFIQKLIIIIKWKKEEEKKKKEINNVDSMSSLNCDEYRATSSKVREGGGGGKKKKQRLASKQDWKELNGFTYGKSSSNRHIKLLIILYTDSRCVSVLTIAQRWCVKSSRNTYVLIIVFVWHSWNDCERTWNFLTRRLVNESNFEIEIRKKSNRFSFFFRLF